MKSNSFVVLMSLVLVTILSGCTSSTVSTENNSNKETTKSEVELVPARKSEDGGSKTVVVERDGKFYEMLKEHERLCHDCDR